MNKKISINDLYPFIENKLKSGSTVTFTVSGYSMQPMIYDRRDTVTVVNISQKLKKYDLILYILYFLLRKYTVSQKIHFIFILNFIMFIKCLKMHKNSHVLQQKHGNFLGVKRAYDRDRI